MSPAPMLPPDPRPAMSGDDLAEASRNAFPVVARSSRGSDRAGLMLGASIAIALGALTFVGLHGTARSPDVSTPEPVPSASAEPGTPLPATAPAPIVAAPTGAPLHDAPTPLPAAVAPLAPSPATAAIPVAVVFDNPAGPVASNAPGKSGPRAGTGGVSEGNPSMLNENEAFGIRVGNGSAESASATRMVDPSSTVAQGTLIPAILETAIDSDLPGYARALVTQDVRSFDGRQVLIPRSSRLIGQYKSGLQAGQTRVYVMWQRLIRPDGVSIALASPAIEFSGESGLGGKVNNHFFKRYGAAILLSLLSGAGSLAGSGTSVVITSGSQGAAAVAAQNDAKTPPTIRVPLGQPIRVFTARDLDFSTVMP